MQRFTLLMGDPLLAAAAVLSGFLFFSGCGSLCSQQWTRSPLQATIVAGVGIARAAPLVPLAEPCSSGQSPPGTPRVDFFLPSLFWHRWLF